jgi:MYXO-CTERM domain-containing protein
MVHILLADAPMSLGSRRSRVIALLLSSAAAACTSHDAGDLSDSAGAVRDAPPDPFPGLATIKIVDLPAFEASEGRHVSFKLLAPDTAMLTHVTKDGDCELKERHLISFSAQSVRPLYPKGNWDEGPISSDRRWMASLGTPGACGAKELYVADLAATQNALPKSMGAASRAFAFMGPHLLVGKPGSMRAIDPASGDMTWEVAVPGETVWTQASAVDKNTPFYAVSPDQQRLFLHSFSAAKVVERDGAAFDVQNFPDAKDKRAAFFPDSTALKLEVPQPEGYELYRLLPTPSATELTKIADHVLKPASFSEDRLRLAFITANQKNAGVQDVNLVELSDLSKRTILRGLGRVSTLDLSPEARSIVVTGATPSSGDQRICAAASSDTDTTFVEIANLSKAHPQCEVTGDGDRVFYMSDVAMGDPAAAPKARLFTRTRKGGEVDLGVDDADGFIAEPAATPASVLVPTASGVWQLVQISNLSRMPVEGMKMPLVWEKGVLYYLDGDSHLHAITSDGLHRASFGRDSVTDVQMSNSSIFVTTSKSLLRLDMPAYALHGENRPDPGGGGLKGPVDPATGTGSSSVGTGGMSTSAAVGKRQEGEETTETNEEGLLRHQAPSLNDGPKAGQEPPSFTSPVGAKPPEPEAANSSAQSEASGCNVGHSRGSGAPIAGLLGVLGLVAWRRRRP